MSLESVLARQAGVVGLDQAIACGISARTVHRRAAEGRWRRLHPRVYLAGGHRLTPEARIRAAALWAGPEAVITGATAAHWHGLLAAAPGRVHLTVPATAKPRGRSGLVLSRRDLDPLDTTARDGLRLATPAFAALETACALPDGSAFLDRALQRRVPFAELLDTHRRNAGRPGFAASNPMIAAAADRADSAAERLLLRLLRGAGIIGWVTGHHFGPFVLDLAFLPHRLAVEVDGWAWHVDAERFRADRRKGNALAAAGWTLLRFTWHDLHARPAEVVAEIRALLATIGT